MPLVITGRDDAGRATYDKGHRREDGVWVIPTPKPAPGDRCNVEPRLSMFDRMRWLGKKYGY